MNELPAQTAPLLTVIVGLALTVIVNVFTFGVAHAFVPVTVYIVVAEGVTFIAAVVPKAPPHK